MIPASLTPLLILTDLLSVCKFCLINHVLNDQHCKGHIIGCGKHGRKHRIFHFRVYPYFALLDRNSFQDRVVTILDFNIEYACQPGRQLDFYAIVVSGKHR